MKKEFLALISASFIASTASHAADFTYIPYAGLDYSYLEAKASTLKPHYQSAGINIGTKYNDFFGTELFFQQSGSDAKKTIESKYKSSFRAYGLDAYGYLPLGCSHEMDLFAGLGISEYVFNKKFGIQKHHNDTGYGYRVGTGLMFNLNENFSLRTMARYVFLDKVSGYDHMMEYSLGLRYHFQ